MKRLLSMNLFLAILLAGCATTHPIKPEKLSSISRVSAVSLLGNELHVTFSGTTIFTNKWLKTDVTNWHIDDFVQEAIEKTIVADGRFSYVDISPDTDTMMKVYGSKEVSPCCARDYDLSLIRDEIQRISSEYGIDTLILVLESDLQDATGNWEATQRAGYGLYQETFLGLKQTFTHIYIRVIVVDTSNLQELSSNLRAGGETIDNRYWKSAFETLAPEEKQFIERSIKVQLWENLITALKKMRLIEQE